ncbi:MAG: restriction endonuclease subunit S [Bacteroidaceae bacterium]|nr:restriction endonuclease subunit S [Bacteroidaceae bacterium]
MKDGWEIKKFECCIGKIPKPQQLKTSDYMSEGKYPIVSQEASMISGYTDMEEFVYRVQNPVVIFGDHTRILKYVDFDFVVGADGVKILIPTENLNAKYFYHFLTWYDIPSLGYSRHYKLLKEINIPIPPLPEQERIVSELDCINGILEKKQEQIKELDALAQSIFYHMFGDPVTNEKGWEVRKLENVCKKLFAGGDVPKENFSPQETDEYNIPIYSNGVGDKALYGYTNISRVEDVSLTISGRGTIGYCELRTPPFFPVVRLIVATPHDDIDAVVLKFILNAMDLKGTGGAIPQLTVPMVKSLPIILPPLPLQQSFATKIAAIEKQKELIKRSIAEVETLLSSRMQHYFG